MKITGVTARAVSFANPPDTLRTSTSSPMLAYRTELQKHWIGDCASVIVEISTDEGLTGVGTAGGFMAASKDVIDRTLSPLLLGEDPLNTERLWEKMYRADVRAGRGGIVVSAISAIDIALWDLKGKFFGTPVYNLLGGRTLARVPVYASRLYATDDHARLREEALSYREQGFTMMKQRFGYGPADGRTGMDRNEALVATVRGAVGDDVGLAADAYMGWDVAYTSEMIKRLEPYGLLWLEEPLLPHDLDGYKYLSDRSAIPISCGEHEYTRWGFRRLIEDAGIRILQPDTNRVGGISEMLKICAIAAAHGVTVIPHSNEAHNLHLVCSQTACSIMEYFPNAEPDTGNELFWRLFEGHPVAEAGFVTPTNAPGLGVTPVEHEIARLRLA